MFDIYTSFIKYATFQWFFMRFHSAWVCVRALFCDSLNQFLHTYDNKIELGAYKSNRKKVGRNICCWCFFAILPWKRCKVEYIVMTWFISAIVTSNIYFPCAFHLLAFHSKRVDKYRVNIRHTFFRMQTFDFYCPLTTCYSPWIAWACVWLTVHRVFRWQVNEDEIHEIKSNVGDLIDLLKLVNKVKIRKKYNQQLNQI